MNFLSSQLKLDSCPHCGRANPTLVLIQQPFPTQNFDGTNERWWGNYRCNTCGSIVTAWAPKTGNTPTTHSIKSIYPEAPIVSESIPDKARELLRQAQKASMHLLGL